MNYLTNYFGGGNAAGGMRRPMIDEGFNPQMMSSTQPSMNLGMGDLVMPKNPLASADTGTGMRPPASFGQMPTGGMDMQNALGLMNALGGMGGKEQPKMEQVQIPMGSNQSYEELMKMYGVRGLLG